MSRARHKSHKAMGGEVPSDAYTGRESNVAKEAREHKHGGKVKKHDRGGKVHGDEAEDKKLIAKEMGKVMGEKAKHRPDKRARGGRVGSDKSPFAPGSATHPFSSAAKG